MRIISILPSRTQKRPHESRSHIYDSLGEGDRMPSRCAVHERSVRYLPSVFDRNARLDRHPIYVPCRPKSPQCPQGREVIKRKPPSPRHAATFASNEGFKVERHSWSAVLTLNERFPQRFHLHLIFLQQAQPGLHNVTDRTIATLRNLLFDEGGEMITEGYGGVLRHCLVLTIAAVT